MKPSLSKLIHSLKKIGYVETFYSFFKNILASKDCFQDKVVRRLRVVGLTIKI